MTEAYKDGKIKIIKDRQKDTAGKEDRKITPLPSFEEIDLMSKKDQDKIYAKIKAKTQITIRNSNKTVGAYIYDTLLQKPKQKIRGKLIRTIDREFYKEEITTILQKQIELQPELFSNDLYNDCIRELYKNNKTHELILSKRDFTHLLTEDILFYQRPFKSQKSLIGNCSLEYRKFKEKDKDENEIERKEYLKVISKSNPLYQEFRVWQWLYNLKIYRKEGDKDVTVEFIKEVNDLENLFTFLMTKKEVDYEDILKHLLEPKKLKAKELKAEIAKHRWNYVFDSEKNESKKYPCNETGYEIRRRLEKVENVPTDFLTPAIENQLWHLIYSVTDKIQFETALSTFAKKHKLDEQSFIENFKKHQPYKSDYGSFSEKAIKKLLPLMRIGNYWNWNDIDSNSKSRVDKIINGEVDEKIKERVREKAVCLTEQNRFQGLQLWLAQYVVYNRHSEAEITGYWKKITDLEKYIEQFKQHSLRNPTVEQIITETLRVVKDIWASDKYGNKQDNFFNEIHVELGREMKNTAEDRKGITKQVTENENTNQRIIALLKEFEKDEEIEQVRAYSPSHQEILKIYEDGVLSSISDEVLKNEKTKLFKKGKDGKNTELTIYDIAKSSIPTKEEIAKYKLWLEQKYRSPYTGEVISLSKLFTPEYQIEHIIPQSRFFDDGLSNKVICEAAVNQLKDNQLGFEFIKNHHGEKVETGFGKTVEIFSEEKYKTSVNEHYDKNRKKKINLLLEDIPDKMIARQMNDTRYISKFIMQVLSNIVRESQNDDEVNSKNIIPGNGKITSRLKQDWGLNDAWNELILPRFERMNELTKTTAFTTKNKEGHTIPTIPFELSKGFQKKRIDHRHHALDALVIACMTRDHVQYLNNENAKSQKFHLQRGLGKKLRNADTDYKQIWEKDNGVWKLKKDAQGNVVTKEIQKLTSFFKPWGNFTKDAKNELDKIVVSFKQNLRVINKATNRYEKIENGKKIEVEQKGVNWAIRKSMHKGTVYGKVYLLSESKEMTLRKALEKVNEFNDLGIIVDKNQRQLITKYYNLNKVDIEQILKDQEFKDIERLKVYETRSATRYGNDLISIFKDVKIKDKAEEIIKKITDTGIQSILLKHLSVKDNSPEIAFSPEGIEDMNKNILSLNNNKPHQPIYRVRKYEKFGNKFNVGSNGNKKDKYVETADSTNLFFAIYLDTNGKRRFKTIPLNIIIERQKQGLSSVPEKNANGDTLLFHLSPNDLVYMPTQEERENNLSNIDFSNLTSEQKKRLYNVNDFSSTCYFSPNRVAKAVAPKEVDMNYDEQKKKVTGSYDTKTASLDNKQIKDVCIKLHIDRLGNTKPIFSAIPEENTQAKESQEI